MLFDRPQSFALLLPVPFVLIFMFVRLRTLRPVIQKLTLRIKLRALLWSFAWLSALIALAGHSTFPYSEAAAPYVLCLIFPTV